MCFSSNIKKAVKNICERKKSIRKKTKTTLRTNFHFLSELLSLGGLAGLAMLYLQPPRGLPPTPQEVFSMSLRRIQMAGSPSHSFKYSHVGSSCGLLVLNQSKSIGEHTWTLGSRNTHTHTNTHTNVEAVPTSVGMDPAFKFKKITAPLSSHWFTNSPTEVKCSLH